MQTLAQQIKDTEAALMRIEHNPDNYAGGLKAYNSGLQTYLKPAAQKKHDKLTQQLDRLYDLCQA